MEKNEKEEEEYEKRIKETREKELAGEVSTKSEIKDNNIINSKNNQENSGADTGFLNSFFGGQQKENIYATPKRH